MRRSKTFQRSPAQIRATQYGYAVRQLRGIAANAGALAREGILSREQHMTISGICKSAEAQARHKYYTEDTEND